MSRVYTTDAIVLRRGRFGEHGVLLTLFTPEQGKVSAIAKGVHRPASKLAGHLEPLLHVRLLAAKGRNLDIVTQAEVLHPFGALRSNLHRTAAAWYAVELVDRTSELQQENGALYDLLLALLVRLDGPGAPDPLLRFFEMRLLTHLGYRPALWQCAQCGASAGAGPHLFSPGQGGLHCAECAPGVPDVQRLSSETLTLLRLYQAGHISQWEAISPSEDGVQAAALALRAAVRALDERAPRSLVLLDRVRGAAWSPTPNERAGVLP